MSEIYGTTENINFYSVDFEEAEKNKIIDHQFELFEDKLKLIGNESYVNHVIDMFTEMLSSSCNLYTKYTVNKLKQTQQKFDIDYLNTRVKDINTVVQRYKLK
jgi:phosphoenolpyruvate-protein kinase (PTS system EI component)